ncbi:phosphatidylinositide phosphatase SAC2-like, partial [Centruroides sculpturatus]|uniref:phosphatidylinositide phosphatase SAC2-like n=1 Tax=Centruroides sculpturatus TaxID=218467 RepID=UPI000C6E3B89
LHFPDVDKKLLLIRQRALVGCLPGGHEVYKIQKIAILPLNQHDVPELDIELCKRHHIGIRKTERSAVECQQRALQKTWNSIRTATAQVKPRRVSSQNLLWYISFGKQHTFILSGEEETLDAFAKHFAEELSIYGNQVIINLVEQTGKEKVLSEAYLNGILSYDCPDLTYISFDFHEYCRGMKFENITILTESIKDIIREMRYCWFDSQGLICEQKGVFRVNCVDCLDRTNIAQTALAKTIMDTQFIKLGLLPPEGILPASCRRVFQMMWANNGDIISRQYAGTAALKGDFTRTGERRFAGMMKDGYTSASRLVHVIVKL